MKNARSFGRATFVTAIVSDVAPRMARAARVPDGPYVHQQTRGPAPTVVLHTRRSGYRESDGRQVAFLEAPDGATEHIRFLDGARIVAQAALVPTDADVIPFAQRAIAFLYNGTLPDVANYKTRTLR